MKRYDELKALVEELEFDFEKFYSRGNKAAGTRLRKGLNGNSEFVSGNSGKRFRR